MAQGSLSLVDAVRALSAGFGHERVARAVAAWEAVIQLTAPDARVYLVVADRGVTFFEGTHIRPTVHLAGAGEDLATGLSGAIDFTHLVAGGQVSVRGRYSDMVNLGRLAAAMRKIPSHAGKSAR